MTALTRRLFLGGGLAAAARFTSGCSRPGHAPPGEASAAPIRAGDPDVEAILRATPAEVVLDPASRQATRVWRYEGRLIRGPSGALTSSGDSYLGPTFRVRPGARVRIRFDNALDEDSVVHWHGLDVSQENDGHPRFGVRPGGTRVYDFEVASRPGTYWYHPHPHERTAPQVYAGLAGLFIVADGDDGSRGLPAPPFELSLVIQDRALGSGGQLVYDPNPMLGFLGDQVFVNGRPTPGFEVREGTYRLRLLNGSNARIYKLAWSDGSPITVIGSDGGLLAAPVDKPHLMLAPGERAEVWADFGRALAGPEIALQSLAFSTGGMMGGMGRGMMGGGRSRASNGAALPVCRFTVRGPGERRPLPGRLEPLAFRPPEEVANPDNPRRFPVSMAMMRWLLNARPFAMTEVASNEHIRRGVTEDWEFSNPGGMMSLPHPIHIHGGQFQVVGRAGESFTRTVADGRIDEGWKDTVLVMPGERVRLRVRFARHAGLFMYHCHNLEHEDMGMMRNFLVEG
jgi:FtsP/CotA-like multicopper oxidase with cupredoxin domain